MDVKKEIITERYALYNGDSCEKMPQLPSKSIGFMIYSPPFNDLYTYSSSVKDLGNNVDYDEFLKHYEYIVKESERVMMDGRIVAVHCMDLPNNGQQGLTDFPGDIIRIHQKHGFVFWDRKNIWKEPLRIAIRTRDRKLMHGQITADSVKTRGALADYVLFFKKKGDNLKPVSHPNGLTHYYGDFDLFSDEDKKLYKRLLIKFENYSGDDKKNRLSQWIWRRYASSDWRDINAKRMIDYKEARDPDDQRHVCPLHLDIIQRSIILYTNENDTVLTPFMGIGSEVYGAIELNRRAIGIELKESYFRQARKNMRFITKSKKMELKFK